MARKALIITLGRIIPGNALGQSDLAVLRIGCLLKRGIEFIEAELLLATVSDHECTLLAVIGTEIVHHYT
jgi:hypothetical protein